MPAPDVDVTLEAPARVAPGVPFEVALRVRAPLGWHVYWAENPGQTGLPTRATLTGVPHTGPRWTAPTLHVGDGDIRSFAYEPEGAAVWSGTAPEQQGQLSLVADVSWLACKESCVPGSTTVRRRVRVSPNATVSPSAIVLPAAAAAALTAEGLLRVCLPGDLAVFPSTAFEEVGVPLVHDGAAWQATLPPGAPDDAALVFVSPDLRSWRVDVATARATPNCP